MPIHLDEALRPVCRRFTLGAPPRLYVGSAGAFPVELVGAEAPSEAVEGSEP